MSWFSSDNFISQGGAAASARSKLKGVTGFMGSISTIVDIAGNCALGKHVAVSKNPLMNSFECGRCHVVWSAGEGGVGKIEQDTAIGLAIDAAITKMIGDAEYATRAGQYISEGDVPNLHPFLNIMKNTEVQARVKVLDPNNKIQEYITLCQNKMKELSSLNLTTNAPTYTNTEKERMFKAGLNAVMYGRKIPGNLKKEPALLLEFTQYVDKCRADPKFKSYLMVGDKPREILQ